MAELKRGRGVPAILRAREDRAAGRYRWTMQAGIVAGVCVVGGLVAHLLVEGHDLHVDRQTLLAKQRAVEATLAVQRPPLRHRLDPDTVTAANASPAAPAAAAPPRGAFSTPQSHSLRLRG